MDIALLFIDQRYRDILSLLKLYLGKKGRRELGKTWKIIYENLGGFECAKRDYNKLYRKEILPWLYAKQKGLNEAVELYYEERIYYLFFI